MKKLVVLVSALIVFSMVPITVSAENGQADVPGKIVFYEDSSIQKPEESSSSSEIKTESSERHEKPVGRFPNTGEMIKKASVWIGIGLILVIIIFLIGKKRRENDEKKS